MGQRGSKKKRTRAEKWQWFLSKLRPLFAQMVTLMLLVLFTVGGAYAFTALESTAEVDRIHRAWELREGFIRELFKQSKDKSQKEWREFYLTWFKEYSTDLCTANAWESIADHKFQWTFKGSLQFCMAMYLTMGYGNMAPVTTSGRLFCIAYALLGIPMAIYMLKTYGIMLTTMMQHAWTVFLRFYYMGKCFGRTIVDPPPILNANRAGWVLNAMSISYGNRTTAQRVGWSRMDYDYSKLLQRIEKYKHEFELPLFLSLLIVSCYIVCGVVYITMNVEEDWNAGITVYYLLISLFTVGFGDYVVSEKDIAMNVYLFVGMVIMSMLIDVVQMKGHKMVLVFQQQLQKSQNKEESQSA